MASYRYLALCWALMLCVCVLSVQAAEETEDKPESAAEDTVDPEKLDYAKGSLCQYCEHCKFCKLCEEDCPCETSPSKPNCKMCKYCKFCYVCKACDTICQPGGILDKFSAAIVNALPSFDKSEVDQDIDSVKDWIEKKKDEL